MYSVKENSMKRKLFGAEDHYDKSESNAVSAEKKRRRKNAVETPKHYPKSERQQLALVLQMTSADKSPEPASPSFASIRKTPGGSGRKDKVHKRNVRGETLLHLCTIRGDLDAMKELIQQGADVNVQDFAGWTPLHEACNHGHQEITRYLLQAGANVNSKGLEDDTPLHDAVTNSHRDLVELLLKHGANPLLKNKRGERPLDMAEDQTIRELMQKEVILSEEESDLEECPSPLRSEDSLSLRKVDEKDRTTSTSSSGFQELFGREKKKHHKSNTNSKSESLALTSDSSLDSDTSDGSSIAPANSRGNLSCSNGFSSSTPRKVQSISTSSLGAVKQKKKRKHMDKSERKRCKMKIHSGSTLARINMSSDGTSDSDDRMQRKDKNGMRHSELGEYSFVKNGKKDHAKQKSLYLYDDFHFTEKNTKQTDPTCKKISSDPGDDTCSSSHDTGVPHSTLKIKSNTSLHNELECCSENTTPPKVNGFQTASNPFEQKKSRLDESVYDFSLSTEDLSNSSAINLRQGYFKDNSSELFDILCLGKSGKISDPEIKGQVVPDLNVQVTSKSINVQSKPLRLSHQIEAFDKNNNEHLKDVSKAPLLSRDSQSCGHTLERHEKPSESLEKLLVVKSSVPQSNVVTSKREDIKSERKIKKHKLLLSPKKSPHGNGPTAIIKSDVSMKLPVDGKQEKLKKSMDTSSSSGSVVKKKKKHKHKHSHDTSSGEHKHRQRVASSERFSLEKPNGVEKEKTNQTKPLLKKSDSTKSVQGTSSRKNSQEGKGPEGGVIPAAKKKARSSDSVGSETGSKIDKHNSVLKVTKPMASTASQEKQTASVSAKKDKLEVKKITLMSDANCSFLSELEKSSRCRLELEKKMKMQRKRKLMQAQRLKAQFIADSVLKEAKPATPTSEKSPSRISDKAVLDVRDSAEATSKPPLRQLAFCEENHTGQVDPRYCRSSVDFHQDTAKSLYRADLSHGMLKSAPLAARSVSQIDQRPLYPENWNHQERPPLVASHEVRNLPVHRSLSFSGPPPGGPLHSDASLHYQGDTRHRHSLTEDQHKKLSNYSGSPTNFPLPHNVSEPLLPSANHLPPLGHFPPAQTLIHKPLPPSAKPPVTIPGLSESTATTFPSNVPISSPLAANVPVHSAAATPPMGSTSNVMYLALVESKASRSSELKTEESIKSCDEGENAEKGNTDTDNANLGQETIEPTKETKGEESNKEEAASSEEKERIERKMALENYINECMSKWKLMLQVPMKLPVFIPMEKLNKATEKDPNQDHLNAYEEWAVMQKQISERRKKYYTAVVIPQAPHCYCDYLTYTGAYLLSGNRESWFSIPVLAPPPSLAEGMRALFVEHEKERVKLRLQHATQREKLIVACEQEIMRVHSRAARMLQNQQIPLSACSVFLDGEIYNLERRVKKVTDDGGNGRSSAVRDRFNGRMMLSWLQDVDDKYVKLKDVLLARQRHESQALHAVQRTEWFLKLQEVEKKSQQKRWTNAKPEDVSELYVPLVNISDDFDLLPG